MWTVIIVLFLLLAMVIQAYHWSSITTDKVIDLSRIPSAQQPAVSIVMAVRDEAHRLRQCVPQLLAQDYADYELIIVDDGSTDETSAILSEMIPLGVNVLHQAARGKKAALTKGIMNATGIWIVCIDADCYPASAVWLKTLLRDQENCDVILGYGPYQPTSNWWTYLLRYETWYIACQYLSAALHGRAYMGVGRNMAFRKNVWMEVGGYSGHQDVRSGDDDLFIASMLPHHRVEINVEPSAWTWSLPPQTPGQLYQQKRRHLTTAVRYKASTQYWLMIIFLSHLASYVLPIALAFLGYPIALIVIVIRWLLISLLSQSSMKQLGISDLWRWMPLWDLGLVIYYVFQGLMMPIKKRDW